MLREDSTPSESEWLIMEVLWTAGEPMTSSEIIRHLEGRASMTSRMVRVLINRLCQKGILGYTVDVQDSRVYHYYAKRSQEECRKEKGRKFVDSYFKGSQTGAVAALLESAALTDEQIRELEEILEKSRGKGDTCR